MGNLFPKPLSQQEEAYYLAKLEEGDEEAKNILIERNLRLVAHVAKKFVSPVNMLDDLISIGTIGLIKGVNTYKSKKSTRLATYVAKCIENEILMSIRTSKKNKQEVSLNLPIGTDKDGNEISLDDILGTDADEIVDSIDLKIEISKLKEAIEKRLNKRERYIIIKRYGLDGEKPMAQREIAEVLNISRSYVSRIEKKILNILYRELDK